MLRCLQVPQFSLVPFFEDFIDSFVNDLLTYIGPYIKFELNMFYDNLGQNAGNFASEGCIVRYHGYPIRK
jgi:hypothetical protein